MIYLITILVFAILFASITVSVVSDSEKYRTTCGNLAWLMGWFLLALVIAIVID